VDEEAIASLQELGLTLYEARLYLGLLTHGPQNGNELSRASGVPSSKVYSTLDKLVIAGIVEHGHRGSTVEYACVPPEELIRRLRARYTRPLGYLEKALPTLAGAHADIDLLRIVGEETVLEHAHAVIARAKSQLYVSAWGRDIDLLADALLAASERGVRTFAMTFGDTKLETGFLLPHSDPPRVAARLGGRMITVVADGRTALISHVPDDGEVSGVVTENPVLCLVVEEYLRHDLVLEKAKTMSGFEEFDDWLQGDDDVRAIRAGHVETRRPVAARAKSR
jgi:HTH-type transcriptional regulator, sugar sensing transcriptional regulator